MNIYVSVDNVEIKEHDKLHEGEYKINKCFFEFSEEYTQNLTSRAIFTTINGTYQETIINNQCDIPTEVLKEKGEVEVGVYSYEIDNGELKLRYSPSSAKFFVCNGSYKEANQSEAPSPSEFEKYLYNFNENAVNKTNEFNKNANEKTEQINKISTDVSNMKVAVETSEQNAKTSENNAKASEIAAQNSANEASASESNIIAIEKNIKSIQEDVQVNKEATDKNVETTNSNVEKANTQAIKAENQAKISTENAAATSADKNAVSEMKSEVEEFKIEAKNCRDEAESFKNETLEAKEVVEKSLEKERIKSEKEYAKAVDTEVITVEEFAQVELDEDGYMEDVSIEAAKEITQEVREGYNKFKNPFNSEIIRNGVTLTVEEDKIHFEGELNDNSSFRVSSKIPNEFLGKTVTLTIFGIENTKIINGGFKDRITGNNVLVVTPSNNSITAEITQEMIDNANVFDFYLTKANLTTINQDLYIQIVEGTEEKPYEAYGVSPSLNYPSDFQNMVKEVDFSNSRKNILDVSLLRDTFEFYGVTFNKTEYGYLLNGKVTSEAAGYLFGESLQGTQENWELSKGTYTFQTSNNKLVFSLVYGGNTILPLGTKNFSEEQKIHGLRFQFSKDAVFNNEKLILQVAKEDKPSEIEPYQGNTNKLALPEGKFIGNFKGYSNAIDKGVLKGQLKEVVLTGNESIYNSSNGNIFRISLDTPHLENTSTQVKTDLVKSNYFNNVSYAELNDASVDNGIEIYNNYIQFRDSQIASVEEWKAKLKELYDAGTPVKILYVAQTEEKQELSQENLQVVNSLQTYQGENNISTPKAKLSFKANQGLSSYVDKVVDDKLVENNISEREISDSKYPRALKPKVSETDFTQVFAENEKIEGLEIYGEELTQETREGYNKLDIKTLNYVMNITIVEHTYEALTVEMTDMNEKANFRLNPVELKAGVIYKIQRDYEVLTGTKQNDTGALEIFFGTTWKKVILGSSQKQGTFTVDEDGTYYIMFKIAETNVSNFIEKIKIKFSNIMLYDYTSQTDKPYEQYGAMPSLDYPSEVQVTSKQRIINAGRNILNTFIEDMTRIGLTLEAKADGSIHVSGVPTATYTPIKRRTMYLSKKVFDTKNLKIGLNYGKSKELLKDSSFNPFLWLRRNSTEINTSINIHNLSNLHGIATDVSIIEFGIEKLEVGKQYDEDIYISVEIGYELPTKFEPYQENNTLIPFPQDTFTGAIGSYKDTIKEVAGRFKVEKWIFKHIVTGKEAIYILTTTPEGANYNEFGINLSNSSLPSGINSCNAISNYFSNKDNNRVIVAGANSVEYIRVPVEYGIDTAAKFRAKLTELYNAGTPVEIYYVLATPDYIDLPDETQKILNGIKLRLGLNNFSIDVGTFSYIYNKSLEKELEEKDQLIEELTSRILALENATLNLAEGE